MKALLQVVEGKPLGAMIPLNGPTYVIGRDPACHLRPKHESVGNQHCRLSIAEGRVSIADLGSQTGTMLNGRRLPPTEETHAGHGDRLQVGNIVFELSIFAHQAAQAPAPVSVPKPMLEPLAPAKPIMPSPNAAPYQLEEENDNDEFDSRAAMLANRLIQQTLGRGADPVKALGAHLRAEMIDGVPCVALELDRIGGDAVVIPLKRELRDLAERADLKRVVLDFHRVRLITAEGVDLLIHFHERLQAKKAKLKICDVDPAVLAVLEAKGFLVPNFLDTHDAVWSSW